MKKLTRILSLALVTVFCVLALASCVNVYLDQVITINSDFSGTRTLSLYLGAYPTNSDNDKVVGYYWINIHGEELRAYLENLYKNDPATSQYNYTITVDDSTLVPTYKADGVTPDPTKMFVAGDEIITISFDYTDFNDYCAKLKALGSFNGGCVERSTKPEHAGLITWVPEEKAGEFVYIWEDPYIIFDYDDNTITYYEPGFLGRMIFGAMWDYIYFNDAYDEETNSDGVYVPSGTNPEKEYSQGKNDMLNGGIKIRVFDGTFGQESYNLSQKVQPNGTNASFIFSDLILQIDEFTEYTMPTLDTSKSLVSIRTTGEASKGTAEITYGKEIDWFVAAKTEGRSTVNEYYYATDEKVGTGKTVSKEFTENGDLTVIGVDGAYRIVKTLSARIYSAIVTLQDADGNMIETFYVADSNETITLPKLDKRGHRYELSTEQVSGFTQDTTITVTYTMIHGITFKKDGKKIGTAIVDHGKGVEASQIPTVEVPEGKILTWDADLTNITEDLIVNAVLSDKPVEQTTTEAEQPAEKKGCGSTLGVSALALVLISSLGMGLKRKH